MGFLCVCVDAEWRVNQMRSGEAEISGDVQPYLPDAKRLKAVGPQSQSATGSAATPASALDAGSSIAAAEIDTELRSRPALMPLTSITPLTMPLTVTRVEAIEETLGGGAEHWHDQGLPVLLPPSLHGETSFIDYYRFRK